MSVEIVAPPAPRAELSDGALWFARSAALVAVLMVSFRLTLGQGVTVGHVLILVLAPLWVPSLRRYTGGIWIACAGLAATLASIWLTIYASSDHQTTTNNLVGNTIIITGAAAGIGVLFWARGLLPMWLIGTVFGAGMLADVVTHQQVLGYNQGSGGQINIWKFAIAVPLAVLLLSLAMRSRRRWVEVVTLLVLALASARFDSRSYFGEFVIAALLVVWQALPIGRRRTSALRIVIFFGVVVAAMYNIGTSLVLSGALGAATQARSLQQVQQAGSIIAGGRPEMGATAALFLSRPFGFGAGTIANNSDVVVAKNGMAQLNYNPQNGYVENFLFGKQIELHSMLGDLWSYAGFAGIAFGVVAAVLLTVVIGRGLAGRAMSGLILFVVVQSYWNLFFNPLLADAPVLVVALGLGLPLARSRRRTAPATAYSDSAEFVPELPMEKVPAVSSPRIGGGVTRSLVPDSQ
jgi:hypothetical protein